MNKKWRRTYVIVGIKHSGDILGRVSAENGLDVVAVVEVVKIEVFGGVGGPKQQRVARVIAVARYWVVIGQRQNDVGFCPRTASIWIPATNREWK